VRNRHLGILIVALLLGGACAAGDEFALVNGLRSQAGLPTLDPDERLARAAARHAGYLDRHREPGQTPLGQSAHAQQAELEGYSGKMPADRALAAGYPHREVLENLSMGYADASGAIDGLMAAIYHRLTFLDLEADQLGAAVGERSRVFLLGRSDIGALCAAPPAAALYRTPVDCLGQPMTRDHYEAMCAALPEQSLFQPPHPVGCPNGVRLEAAFMARVCERPPREARFRGHGRYYEPCGDGTRLDADWFDALCERPPAGAQYTASGRYYELCEPNDRVYAEWLEAQCAALPAEARYRDSWHYRRPCADELDVRVEYLDQLDAARQQRLPEVVLWPPADGTGIPPAFFIEEPDPLPDLAVAGYPVSIQFNPARVRRVVLQSFRLLRVDGESQGPVEPVRLLDKASDPNQLLSEFEFALFPLARLDWGARYRAVVEALWDGRPHRYAWTFETQGRDMPVLTATRDRHQFSVEPGVDYLLYLPPREGRPHTVLTTRAEYRRGSQLDLKVLDPNTLRVRVDARRCGPVNLQFDAGRMVRLLVDGCPG